jgi:hypothetical protein
MAATLSTVLRFDDMKPRPSTKTAELKASVPLPLSSFVISSNWHEKLATPNKVMMAM